MTLTMRRLAAALLATSALTGCAATSEAMVEAMAARPSVNALTPEGRALAALPAGARPLSVAIYRFQDLTGQRKPAANVAELSTAVTQGAHTMLIDAALRAGGGTWFQVVERAGMENLLQERQIIRQQRAAFEGVTNNGNLPPLVFAGALLEGGVIGYDTNVLTGGIGARLLGIGGFTEYRADQVEVSLRLSSVQTGEVMSSVTASKTVFSTKLQGNVFRYVAFDQILEGDVGFTVNEPTNVAVRAAIDAALKELIIDAVERGLMGFADPEAGAAAVERHRSGGRPADAAAEEMVRDLPVLPAEV